NVSNRTLSPDGIVRFTLRNDYAKAITAYRDELGPDGAETSDRILCPRTDCGIAPGATIDAILIVSREVTSKPLIISGVLLDDGTADGDPDAILLLREYRLGESLQMKVVRSLLGEAVGASSDELPGTLESVESKVKASGDKFTDLTIYPGGYRAGWVGIGAHTARDFLSQSLSEVGASFRKDRMTGLVRFQNLVEFVNDKTTLLDQSVRQAGMKTQ
ncbi:MAG: hypothetical protein ACREDR_22700, partial [Blastocatellia bacterium]